MLKLMYITKSPEIARIAENAGCDRIFVDLEKLGKEQRQGGMNTVKSDHTVADAAAVRRVLKKAELLVRVNPMYDGSEEEIRSVIDAGADIVMLPYFKRAEEAEAFSGYCAGRAKVMLLVETKEAASRLDEILRRAKPDFVHVGLNDLHLDMKKKFMFELLADGTVEKICQICKNHHIPYGFGGIAGLGHGLLPAEYVLAEHVRLGSSAVILSRSFCDLSEPRSTAELTAIFNNGIAALRAYEKQLQGEPPAFFEKARAQMRQIIQKITEGMP